MHEQVAKPLLQTDPLQNQCFCGYEIFYSRPSFGGCKNIACEQCSLWMVYYSIMTTRSSKKGRGAGRSIIRGGGIGVVGENIFAESDEWMQI